MSETTSRKNRQICIPFSQPDYMKTVFVPLGFRAHIDEQIARSPELFPAEIANGYTMKDFYYSKKLSIPIRRIEVANIAYTVRPSFVMPYMVGLVEDIEKPLFLRKFSVPFWGLAYVFRRDSMYWYRIQKLHSFTLSIISQSILMDRT